jgi:tRNA (Thr-GGU) A37 N-methylase
MELSRDVDLVGGFQMKLHFSAIGIIHTPFQETDHAPIQSSRSEEIGIVEVFPEYLEGLDGTPLLDIKLYVPDFDIHSVSKIGW